VFVLCRLNSGHLIFIDLIEVTFAATAVDFFGTLSVRFATNWGNRERLRVEELRVKV
jgi:hypothetical protein